MTTCMCMLSPRGCASSTHAKWGSYGSRWMLLSRMPAIGLEVDLEASPEMLLVHFAARWDIEVLFADGKEELGLDQYQLMSASALVRFWTLAMLVYVFLEEERHRLQEQWQHH